MACLLTPLYAAAHSAMCHSVSCPNAGPRLWRKPLAGVPGRRLHAEPDAGRAQHPLRPDLQLPEAGIRWVTTPSQLHSLHSCMSVTGYLHELVLGPGENGRRFLLADSRETTANGHVDRFRTTYLQVQEQPNSLTAALNPKLMIAPCCWGRRRRHQQDIRPGAYELCQQHDAQLRAAGRRRRRLWRRRRRRWFRGRRRQRWGPGRHARQHAWRRRRWRLWRRRRRSRRTSLVFKRSRDYKHPTNGEAGNESFRPRFFAPKIW